MTDLAPTAPPASQALWLRRLGAAPSAGRMELGAALLGAFILLTQPNPLLLLGLALLAAPWALRRAAGRPLPRTALDVPVGLLLTSAALGLFVSSDPTTAGIRWWGLVAAAGVCYASAPWLLADRALRAVPWIGLAFGVLGSLAVLALTRGQVARGELGKLLAPLLDVFSVFPPLLAAPVMETNTRFIVNYNGLGDLALLVVAAGLLLAPRLPVWRRLGMLALAGAFGLVVVATGGRGSLVGLMGGLLVLALSASGGWLGRLPAWRLIAGAGLALVGVGLGLSGVLDKGLQTDSLGGRAEFWRDLLAMLGDFAYTGVGLGMQAPLNAIVAYALTPRWDALVYAHNLFLQAYLEQGPVGAVALAMLVIVGAVGGILALRRPLSPAGRVAVRLGLAALVGMTLHGLTDQVPTSNYGTLMLLAAALLCVAPLSNSGAAGGAWLGGRALLGAGVIASFGLALLVAQPRQWADLPANLGALEAAKAATKSGDWQSHAAAAEQWLGLALSWSPDHTPALRQLARVKLLRNDPAGAAQALARATASGSLSPFDAIQIGRLYYQIGFLEEGRRWTRFGIEAGNGLNRHAALEYDRLLLDQDWRTKTLVEQAEDLRNKRQYSQALPLFQQALELAPDNRYLLDQVGEVGRAAAG